MENNINLQEENRVIIEQIRQYLFNVTHINNCISILQTIDKARKNYHDRINLAPTFFGVTEQALIINIIVNTYKIFDFSVDEKSEYGIKPNKNSRNLGQFLEMMKMKTKYLRKPLYNGEEIGDEPKKMVDKSIQELYQHKSILLRLKFQRDKIYAHSDKAYFLFAKQKDLGENELTYEDIRTLMIFAETSLNNFLHYLGEIPQLALSADTDDLLKIFI